VRSCYFIMVLSLLSCSAISMDSSGLTDLDRASDQVTIGFAKKVVSQGLHICGIGGRENKGKIEWFEVAFQYDKMLDVPKARQLIVETTELFLLEINNDENVQKYLPHYPFTPKDIIIAIFPNCSKIPREEWKAFVMPKNKLGEVSYRLDDEVVLPLHEIHKETFEEALEIVKRSEDERSEEGR
jgi:hypothetical protein